MAFGLQPVCMLVPERRTGFPDAAGQIPSSNVRRRDDAGHPRRRRERRVQCGADRLGHTRPHRALSALQYLPRARGGEAHHWVCVAPVARPRRAAHAPDPPSRAGAPHRGSPPARGGRSGNAPAAGRADRRHRRDRGGALRAAVAGGESDGARRVRRLPRLAVARGCLRRCSSSSPPACGCTGCLPPRRCAPSGACAPSRTGCSRTSAR